MNKNLRMWLAGVAIGVASMVVSALATDEFDVTGTLKVNNGSFSLTRTVQALKCDQAGRTADYAIQAVTLGSTNQISCPNTGTPYWAWFRNLDGTNDVYVTCTIKLRASDFAILPLANTNVTTYCTAGTNNYLEFWLNAQ